MSKKSIQRIKVVFLGDASVGKTSLLNRFIYDTFDSSINSTVGIDFVMKNIYNGDTTYKLCLWDTAGQEQFKSLIPSYLSDAKMVIIMYDVTIPKSYSNLNSWYELLQEKRGNDEVKVMLVGNKIDKMDKRKIDQSKGKEKSEEFGAQFAEVSAKTGEGVTALFKLIASSLLDEDFEFSSKTMQGELPLGLNNGDTEKKKTSCCS